MNIRLSDGKIRLRLSPLEAEALLESSELTITISWFPAPLLEVKLGLSHEVMAPELSYTGSSLSLLLNHQAFLELYARRQQRDAALSWEEESQLGCERSWLLEIDRQRPRSLKGPDAASRPLS